MWCPKFAYAPKANLSGVMGNKNWHLTSDAGADKDLGGGAAPAPGSDLKVAAPGGSGSATLRRKHLLVSLEPM